MAFTGQMTQPTASKHWKKSVGRRETSTVTTPPGYNMNTRQQFLDLPPTGLKWYTVNYTHWITEAVVIMVAVEWYKQAKTKIRTTEKRTAVAYVQYHTTLAHA